VRGATAERREPHDGFSGSRERELSAVGFARGQIPRLEAALERALVSGEELDHTLAEGAREAAGVRGAAGGRRWRPLLTLAAARAVGGDPEELVPVATAVELTHTASLVLDDLPCMDDGDLRRGRPAIHRLLGPADAILLAVSCLARAVELLARSPIGGRRICEEWGRTVGARGMAGGQAIDLTASLGERLTGRDRRVHRRKTTALSAFALSAGAVGSGASEDTRRGLAAFGRDVGWAYQLADDARDRLEDRRLGRPPGGRSPGDQSRRILARAVRRLEGVPELSEEGVRLLRRLGGSVVRGESWETGAGGKSIA